MTSTNSSAVPPELGASAPLATAVPEGAAQGNPAAGGAQETWRRWLAVGGGVGVECQGDDLLVTAVRLRFGRVLRHEELRIAKISKRPAAEWGGEYAAFLKSLDVSHLAANLVLPRDAATVRVLALPPLGAKELEAAVGYQLDSLHPYAEDAVTHAWAKLKQPGAVMVAVAREETVRSLAALFAEAGISLASMTVGPACIYSALRLCGRPPARQFLAVEEGAAEAEYYGESASRAVLSHIVPSARLRSEQRERIADFARSELRLEPEAACLALRDLLPRPPAPETAALPGDSGGGPSPAGYSSVRCWCAALTAASPWFALSLNLLPAEMRKSNSRLIFAPTAILGAALLVCAVAYFAESAWERQRFLRQIEAEIARVTPDANRAAELDRKTADGLSRSGQIGSFLARTKADLDALDELTRVLKPPVFVSSMKLSRGEVNVSGEAESAAGLLKLVDASEFFGQSAFRGGIGHGRTGEAFRIVTKRRKVIP